MKCYELLEILSKPWANVKDIQLITNCGRDKATEIRNNISDKIKKDGKFLPSTKEKIVPMEKVIEYLNLNIEYITLIVQKEKIIKEK